MEPSKLVICPTCGYEISANEPHTCMVRKRKEEPELLSLPEIPKIIDLIESIKKRK